MNRMIKILSIALLALFSLFIASCATMSKQECLTADWYLKGLEDGTNGQPLQLLQEHAKACARVDVKPVREEYFTGHEKGVRLYCKVEKGYAEGRRGAAYYGVCPEELEPEFLRAYRDGQDLFAIERNINSLKSQIENDHNLIRQDYDEMARLKSDIVGSNDERERDRKMNRIDQLQMEITNLQIQIDRNHHELRAYEHDFDVVSEKHYRMGYIR